MSFTQDLGYEDQFGKLIGDTTKNKADLAAHHDFSPERWRYFRRDAVSGGLTREFVQYGETTGFADNVDSFTIAPTADDYIAQLESAERFRYIVGYTESISFALQTNQSLATGDKVVLGYGNPDLENGMASADGWFLEFEPGLADNEAYFNEYRNGTIVSNGGTNTLVQFEKGVTDWRRLEFEFNWYNTGSAVLTETFTDADGRQQNVQVAEIAPGDTKGAQTANKNLTFSMLGGGGGTQLEVGSASVIINGNVDELQREKASRQDATFTVADSWVPVFAIRSKQTVGKQAVQIGVRNLSPLRYTGQSDEVELQVKGFDETKVAFGGTDSWRTPDSLTPTNTAFEVREDPTQIADRTGTLQTDTTTPGGYQLFRSELSPTGQDFSEGAVRSPGSKINRSIFDGDVGVVLVKSPVTDETVSYNYSIKEGW